MCYVLNSTCFQHYHLSGDNYKYSNFRHSLDKGGRILVIMAGNQADKADAIYVINVGGYIGESTKREIEYALRNGK